MSIYSSKNILSNLYDSLCSEKCNTYIKQFIEIPNATNYDTMKLSIINWINSSGPQEAISIDSNISIPGLRVLIVDADGSVIVDTIKTNTYQNYLAKTINENHNTRTYNIGAAISQDGIFYQEKYSTSVENNLIYLATRIGINKYKPIGNIVISILNTPLSTNKTIKELVEIYTLKYLKNLFSLGQLKDEYTFAQLKTEFTLAQLKTEFTFEQLKDHYTLAELKDQYNIEELKGYFTPVYLVNYFTLQELKSYFTISDLFNYYSVSDMISNYTIPQLNSVYALTILKDYFTFDELNVYFDEATLNSNGIFRPIIKTLFFSKYMEGSSNNKAVEIYNPTDADINLDLYGIPYVINGANTNALIDVPEAWVFFPSGAIIKANSKYLIVNPATTIINPKDTSNVDFVPASSTAYPTGYNGDDGIKLVKFNNVQDKTNKVNYTILDTIGTFTKVSPGNSPWNVAGISNATQDKTIIRKPTIVKGNPTWETAAGTNALDSEWIVYPQNTITSTYQTDASNVGLPSYYNNVTWSFGTSTPVIIQSDSISNINGLRHTSTYNNAILKTQGIVTAKANNGFYIQDGTSTTTGSCGLFIYTGVTSTYLTNAKLGDLIEITGTLIEYGYTNSLSTTELSTITKLDILSSNNTLPEPINIGESFNNYPSLVIDDANINNFNPSTSALDFWENYEGMLVRIDKPNVIGQKKDFGSFAITLDMPNPNRKNTKYGGVLLDENHNPDVMLISDVIMYQDPIFYKVYPGDKISSITGIVSYNYGVFNILPRTISDIGTITNGEIGSDLLKVKGTAAPPAFRAKEALNTIDPSINHIMIATTNQFNLTIKVNESRVTDYIRINVKAPHILLLQEIQDDNGTINNGVVTSDTNLSFFVGLLNDPKYNAYFTRNYSYVYIAPENNQDGGAPGANIRVAIVYDTLTFEVQSSKRIGLKEDTDAFANSRKPLYVVFKHKITGTLYHIINVHNKSKSGDNSPWGSVQPPVQTTLPQRIKQTTYIKNWITANLNVQTDNIVISGDFNDYEFSDSIKVFDDNTENRFMKNLINDIPDKERYSFYYNGTYHAIDMMIVSKPIYDKIKSVFDTTKIGTKDYIRYSDVLSTQLWLQALGEPLLTDHNPALMRVPF